MLTVPRPVPASRAPRSSPPRAASDAAPRVSTGFAGLARFGQIALGLIWLIDGILQFQPYMFRTTFITGVVLPNAQGQPDVISAPLIWIADQIEPHVAVFNAFAATLQTLIGLGLLHRRTVRPALLLSFGWGLGVWFMGEGLGGFFNDTANPLTGAPGAVLLYLLIGLMVWPEGEVRVRGRSFGYRGRELGLVGVRGARMIWATLWIGFAILWLVPANDSAGAVRAAIETAPTGTGWLTSIVDAAGRAAAGAGTPIALVLAALSAAIGVAVYRGWHTKPFLIVSIVLSLVFWVVGQGIGGIFTGTATDVNAAPLLILMAVLLYRAVTLRQAAMKRHVTVRA